MRVLQKREKRPKRDLVLVTDHYGWRKWDFSDGDVAFCGWIETENGQVRTGNEAGTFLADHLKNLNSLESVVRLAESLKGNFAFILSSPRGVAAAVDRKRSYPVFYGRQDERTWVWSNNARHLKSQLGEMKRDPVSWLEFEMAGYVTGPYTLFEGLYQLQAGECAWWDGEAARVETQRYFNFFSRSFDDRDERTYIRELTAVCHDIFDRLIQRLAGRRVWIPLSGGLDSRFILAMLKEKGYRDIQTFAYGAPGNKNWEVRYSREFARSLNVPWRFIVYTPVFLKGVFHSSLWNAFGIYADNLCSLPGYNMLYALEGVKAMSGFHDDDVVINGQTGDFISGNHIPLGLCRNPYTHEGLIEHVLEKHFSLWLDLKSSENIRRIVQRLEGTWKPYAHQGDSATQAAQLGAWEWQERQAKYVVNGQRGYDFYGLKWELPLWDDSFLFFWRRIPLVWKKRQRLYRKMLEFLNPAQGFRGYQPDRRPSFVYYWGSRVIGRFLRFLPEPSAEEWKRRFLTGWMDPFNAHSVFTSRGDKRRLSFHRNAISYYAWRHKRELLENF